MSGDGIKDICGVKIVRFECISKKQANLKLLADRGDIPYSQVGNFTTVALKEFLSTNVDILMVTNTYGDAQTTVLMTAVNELKSGGGAKACGQSGNNNNIIINDLKPNLNWNAHNADPVVNTVQNLNVNMHSSDASDSNTSVKRQVCYPLVVMDLPNLGIPKNWRGLQDAFVAPSKATGLHHLTLKYG